MKKLSPAQLAVLTAMAEGWELYHRHSILGGYWLGFPGRSGGSRNANTNTVCSLTGLIELKKAGFPSSAYRLSAAGREALKAAKAPAAPATRGKGKVKR